MAREPIIYTSGTTGKPKGVRRFPMTAPGAAEQMRKALGSAFGLKDGMRTLVLSPFYHAGPASYLRAAMATMKPPQGTQFRLQDAGGLRTVEAHL